MASPTIGIIAGKGLYPPTFINAARQGCPEARLVMAAFEGETSPSLETEVEATQWMRVGQLGKLIRFFKTEKVDQAIMVGQITPSNLFQLRPDMKALLMLAKLKKRNAESMFGAIAEELAKEGIKLLPATTYLEDLLPPAGPLFGPTRKERDLEDARYAFDLAKKTSALDIGQCVVVRRGTVIAVEAFEGTNECLKRAGKLGRQRKLTLAKVSKPNQDMRFDVPVIGPDTIRNAANAGINTIAFEGGMTLILGSDEVKSLCEEKGIALIGL